MRLLWPRSMKTTLSRLPVHVHRVRAPTENDFKAEVEEDQAMAGYEESFPWLGKIEVRGPKSPLALTSTLAFASTDIHTDYLTDCPAYYSTDCSIIGFLDPLVDSVPRRAASVVSW